MAQAAPPKIFPKPEHNHEVCATRALDLARSRFDEKGLRLTPLRQRVFEEIASSHRAIGAYEVLERLADKGPRLAPISVYRSIDALLEAGVVHRLESRNAYFACHAGHTEGRHLLIMMCERCGRVAESADDKVFAAIDQAVKRVAFKVRQTVAEIAGLCADCAGQDAETNPS